ncbi:MAG: alpha/beta hydrolase [Actinobacteria bacterium]|nr:alpha/beta hydrolase [Actinomycetota bacterium]
MGRYVDTNGIRLNVVEQGKGRCLVLMPGLTANARFFDSLVAAGLADDRRVVAVDLRGRGLSDKPASGYSMADHALDVLGLLDALGLERADIGGHSFGGLLTYYLAANHADRVERCVVLDAPATVDPGILEQIRPALERLGATVPSFEEYLEMVRAMPYYEGWWDPRIEDYFRADVEELPGGSVRTRSRSDNIAEAVEGTLEVDWPDTVRRIRQPTLLVRATGSFGPPGSPPILSEAAASETLGLLAGGRLVELAGNHMTAFFGESAGVGAAAIRAFLGTPTV